MEYDNRATSTVYVLWLVLLSLWLVLRDCTDFVGDLDLEAEGDLDGEGEGDREADLDGEGEGEGEGERVFDRPREGVCEGNCE